MVPYPSDLMLRRPSSFFERLLVRQVLKCTTPPGPLSREYSAQGLPLHSGTRLDALQSALLSYLLRQFVVGCRVHLSPQPRLWGKQRHSALPLPGSDLASGSAAGALRHRMPSPSRYYLPAFHRSHSGPTRYPHALRLSIQNRARVPPGRSRPRCLCIHTISGCAE